MERQRRLPWRKCRRREKGAAPTLHLPAEKILLSLAIACAKATKFAFI